MKIRLLSIQMFGEKELEYSVTDDNGVPLETGIRVPFEDENCVTQWQTLCERDAENRFAGAQTH